MKRQVGGFLLPAVLLIACLAETPAAAADDDWSARKIIGGTVNRARRAVAIGPMIGAGFAFAPSPGEFDVPITFGIGVDVFKIPIVPSPKMIQDIVKERVQAKVLQRAKQMIREGGTPPSKEDLARMGLEVFEEVKAEVLGELNVRPKVLEKPKLALAFEGAYLPRAADWQVRMTVGIGVSKITIGPTLALHLGTDVGVFVGGEAAVHLLPTKSPRSPVVDVFLRVDFAVTDAYDGLGILGVRLMLDII